VDEDTWDIPSGARFDIHAARANTAVADHADNRDGLVGGQGCAKDQTWTVPDADGVAGVQHPAGGSAPVPVGVKGGGRETINNRDCFIFQLISDDLIRKPTDQVRMNGRNPPHFLRALQYLLLIVNLAVSNVLAPVIPFFRGLFDAHIFDALNHLPEKCLDVPDQLVICAQEEVYVLTTCLSLDIPGLLTPEWGISVHLKIADAQSENQCAVASSKEAPPGSSTAVEWIVFVNSPSGIPSAVTWNAGKFREFPQFRLHTRRFPQQ